MKTKELRELSIDQLQERLEELSKSIFNHRFNRKVSTVENPLQARNDRREIARIKTILNARGNV
jgi:large subunit ribosomal protein L29